MGSGLRAKKSEYATEDRRALNTIDVAGGQEGGGITSPDNYMSAGGAQSRMSGASLGNTLPDLQKINLSRIKGGANNSQTIDTSSNGKLRKASPEALALMMANMKKGPDSSHSS